MQSYLPLIWAQQDWSTSVRAPPEQYAPPSFGASYRNDVGQVFAALKLTEGEEDIASDRSGEEGGVGDAGRGGAERGRGRAKETAGRGEEGGAAGAKEGGEGA